MNGTEMIILSYIDVRPYLFLAGLPIFVLLVILVCRLAGVKLRKIWVGGIASLIFTGLFVFLLTGFGPFVAQEEIREYRMTWAIQPPPTGSKITQSKVVLTFVEFPAHFIYHYSDDLAQHLRTGGKEEVEVTFEVTSDYGKVRGFSEVEIAGLKGWKHDPEGFGGGGVTGNGSAPSPWGGSHSKQSRE